MAGGSGETLGSRLSRSRRRTSRRWSGCSISSRGAYPPVRRGDTVAVPQLGLRLVIPCPPWRAADRDGASPARSSLSSGRCLTANHPSPRSAPSVACGDDAGSRSRTPRACTRSSGQRPHTNSSTSGQRPHTNSSTLGTAEAVFGAEEAAVTRPSGGWRNRAVQALAVLARRVRTAFWIWDLHKVPHTCINRQEPRAEARGVGCYANPAADVSRTSAQDSCENSAQTRARRSPDRTCVLVASAGLWRDPSGRAPRTGSGRRCRAHRTVGDQPRHPDARVPRHRDARVPRRRAAGPAREDAGAVPGGGLPGAGQVRLPERRRRGGRAARPARPCAQTACARCPTLVTCPSSAASA